jgi:hypothetical protein
MGCGCTPNDDIAHCGTSISDLKKQAIKYVLAQGKCKSIDCITQNEYVTYNHGGGQKGTQQSMTEQACWKENYGGLKDFFDKNKFYFLSTLANTVKQKNKFNKTIKNKKVGMQQRKVGIKMLKESNSKKRHAVLFMLESINKFSGIC